MIITYSQFRQMFKRIARPYARVCIAVKEANQTNPVKLRMAETIVNCFNWEGTVQLDDQTPPFAS